MALTSNVKILVINHFYQNIQGWFTFPRFYSSLVEQAKDGYHFVEVGTWKGKSACYMAVEIINSKKKIRFDCVDTWMGNGRSLTDIVHEPLLRVPDGLYNHFLENIKDVQHVINPIRKPSLEAANLYADNTLNCVFIDAAHDYKNVFSDVKAWLPKIKSGGILAGHDFKLKSVEQALKDSLGLQNITQDKGNVWIYYVK